MNFDHEDEDDDTNGLLKTIIACVLFWIVVGAGIALLIL